MKKELLLCTIGLGWLVSSCNKPDQTVVCYFTPTITVHPNTIPADKSMAGLYLVDTASGNIVDSMSFENAFYQLTEEDGTTGTAFDINKEDRLFFKKDAAAHYVVVYNKELGTNDTLSHFFWESKKLKNGCVAITDASFRHKGQTYHLAQQKLRIW